MYKNEKSMDLDLNVASFKIYTCKLFFDPICFVLRKFRDVGWKSIILFFYVIFVPENIFRLDKPKMA